jgi:hypothetical protein
MVALQKMVICVTRYNNKTQYENLLYNLKQPFCENYDHYNKMFKNWNSVKIPKMEKIIESKYRLKMRTDDKLEKHKLSIQIANIRKDVKILKEYEKDFYKQHVNTVKIPYTLEWIYNVPISLHVSINHKKVYIVEMNNDLNEVLAISSIQNNCYHRRHKIYADTNYNRYSYKGVRININHSKLIKYKTDLEEILFKGSTHQKRGQGIQQISKCNLDKINMDGLYTDIQNVLDSLHK